MWQQVFFLPIIHCSWQHSLPRITDTRRRVAMCATLWPHWDVFSCDTEAEVLSVWRMNDGTRVSVAFVCGREFKRQRLYAVCHILQWIHSKQCMNPVSSTWKSAEEIVFFSVSVQESMLSLVTLKIVHALVVVQQNKCSISESLACLLNSVSICESSRGASPHFHFHETILPLFHPCF